MTIFFKEISIKGVKIWKDSNGKRRQKTKTFSQTINPYNVDADGYAKSGEQIYKELMAKRQKWLDAEETEARDENGD
jgi:hypothetical protein